MRLEITVTAILAFLVGIATHVGYATYRESREAEWLRFVELRDQIYQLDNRIEQLRNGRLTTGGPLP